MIRPIIKMSGLKPVTLALDKLERKLVRACDEEIKKAGEAVARDAQALAPRDNGDYAKNIKSKFVKNRISPYARVASWLGGRPSPLGHIIEFGHWAVDPTKASMVGRTSVSSPIGNISLDPRKFKKGKLKGLFKRTGRFVPGKAHLLPALERHKQRLIDGIRKSIAR